MGIFCIILATKELNKLAKKPLHITFPIRIAIVADRKNPINRKDVADF
jgi:hypothetical protein